MSIKPSISVATAIVRDFFSGELKNVMERQHLSAQGNAIEYLADLLARYMESEAFFAKNSEGKLENNVLANLYSEYVHGSIETKKISLQRLGDICLIVSGFFADSLKRKLVDVDYYLGMGGAAYFQLSQFHISSTRSVYEELATKFRPFSDVLGELSERSGLQSNSDLLRLYERWLFSGNERLRALLSEHGIAVPLKIDPKIRH